MKMLNYSNRIDEDSDIEAEFAKIIEEILNNKDAEALELHGNGLTREQIFILADILTEHSNLKFLGLYANESSGAMLAIKRMIETHPALESIYLDLNKINDDDIHVLVSNNSEALNNKLKSIKMTLSSNRITKTGLEEMQDKLSPYTILSTLSGNLLHDVRDKLIMDGARQKAYVTLNSSQASQQNAVRFSAEPQDGSKLPSQSSNGSNNNKPSK